MGRPKRRQPYNPVLAEYQRQVAAADDAKRRDRKSKDLLRNAQVSPIEVDDPDELGGKLIVMRSTRNDPLAGMHARHSIDEAQYQAGRAFQADFETAERGPRAIDPSKEAVDGGRMPEPITDAQQKAVKRLNRAERELGQSGSGIVHDVLIRGLAIEAVGRRREMTGELELKYLGRRFRECLDCLALVYGFAMSKK